MFCHVRALIEHIVSWYHQGRARYELEANWLGKGTIHWGTFSEDRDTVHRIKIDEEIRIIITTHEDGGLVVRDMDTDEILWALPRVCITLVNW